MTAILLGTLFVAVTIGLLRLHPFLALTLGAILAGSLAPSQDSAPERVFAALEATAGAFGDLVGAIGIAIALAAIIGDCLLRSGAADRIAGALLGLFGERRAPWALAAAAYVLSIPVFFDTVFFLLVPLARALARRAPGRYPMFVMAICAGAVATHSLVPPTPGPLGMADNLGFDLGTAIGFGLLLGVLPVSATLLIAPRFARGLDVEPAKTPESGQATTHAVRPGLFASLFPIALPVVLMSGASVAAAGGGLIPGTAWAAVLGHRNAALFLAAFTAAFVLWMTHRPPVRRLLASFGNAIGEAGPIILITAAGGAFGRALAGAGVTEDLARVSSAADGTVLLLLAAAIASLLKLAQGSGTVAILTGSAIVASLVPDPAALSFHPAYLFAAVGFGSMVASWMNDSGFWVVGRMSGFSEGETFRTWTAVAAAVGVFGVIQVLVLATLFPLV
ncbi:MAG: GntP family permease [Acidobacteria bacterium]|nr:GntP family permease [Acidobacteriota bacterium]MYA45032.1 GntP family permease [Acidobacteriota bacterium]MYI39829.1 GntP family permease [Acidobacteriota bacterium]